MPKSKHRRKPGGKAVAHPGRDKSPSREPDWSEVRSALLALAAKPVEGLPLFDWAEAQDRPVVVTAGAARKER